MSLEASAQGTSAECAEMTPVVLEGALHEMQTKPQSSLLLTSRPPIDGEPNGCKQEVADSDVTAECTNRTVKMTKPTEITDVDSEKAVLGGELVERACRVDKGDEMDVDVNRMVLLGREPAERASGVNEGNGTEHRDLRLQQTNLLCEETRQHNGNVEDNIPIANRLPLEGEWTVYPSGKMKNLNGGNASREVEPTDVPNKSDMLVIMLIESEDLGSGDTPCVYLGGMQMWTGDANGLGNRADALNGQVDGSNDQTDTSRAWTDTLNVSDNTETANVSHGDDVSTYLGPGGTKRDVRETDGVGSHADMPTRQMHAPSVKTDRIKPENKMLNVRKCRIGLRTQNSLNMHEAATPKPTYQWRMVSPSEKWTSPSVTQCDAIWF